MAVVKILYSPTTGHVPSSLVAGQLAINTADGILYWLASDGLTVEHFNFLNLTVTKQPDDDVSLKIANTQFVKNITDALTAAIVGSPSGGLDTLEGLASAINNDPAYFATIAGQMTSRLRFDNPQILNNAQMIQVMQNIGLTSRDITLAMLGNDYKGEG